MSDEGRMSEAAHEETADPKEVSSPPHANVSPTGVSPYSTGGGGVTFERKVASLYLGRLLTGTGASELGDGRRVTSVRFQQAPEHPVDDLVVCAQRGDEGDPSLLLAIAVRRAPDIVRSNAPTTKLITDFVRAVVTSPTDGPECRFALVVAGWQQHAAQLATLAGVASSQMAATDFFNLVQTPQRYDQSLRGRLEQVEGIVHKALISLGNADPDEAIVKRRTWELLSRLTVLMPRIEPPDETDWDNLWNDLVPVARGQNLAGATALRDRLTTLAAEYAPAAATVDLSLLRRDAHAALDTTVRRQTHGWGVLAHLNDRAESAVHNTIRSTDGSRTVHIDRNDAAAKLLGLAGSGRAVLAHGESGIGKSALVVRAATSAATADPDVTQVLCVNLRDLPATTVELETILGRPLAALLDEVSAPKRLLVIDGADAVNEQKQQVFAYLVDAAHDAGLGVVAVSTTDSQQAVRDALNARYIEVVEHRVAALTDAEVDEVVAVFPELTTLASNARSRDLLRRPVVADLLVRSGVSGLPLSDADAMRQVWAGLVRRNGPTDRGTPDAREWVMLHLAEFTLRGGNALEVTTQLDAVALNGLRRDGLLRAPSDNEWQILPEFAHDEIRRYAVARVLLVNSEPARAVREAGAPRWALPSARLACQALLASPHHVTNPIHGRLARLQESFDALVDAGHGARWGDVPAEALLTIGDPGPLLTDAWTDLRDHDAAGLRRLARLLDQRHRRDAIVDSVVVEPIITGLLDDQTPWWPTYVATMIREWLHALVVANTVVGAPLRIRLRELLVAECNRGDARLVREREETAAALAARTPEEVEKHRQRSELHRSLYSDLGYSRSMRTQRPEVPQEITDDVLELLALLGPDLGIDGERVLRRVADDAPWNLAPVLEEALTGRALASYGPRLLADLTEAYYVESDSDRRSGFMDDGIRRHHTRGLITPLHAWYRGPFMPLFQTDLRRGLTTLNRMLNHAALARAQTLASSHGHWGQVSDEDVEQFMTELSVTGELRTYVGDGHVWLWYRGTGVGPYPCMSALAALEIVCDQHIAADVPLPMLIELLLDGCESLAMLGLVVGILVRHLDRAGTLLDPYLAEPAVWNLEFNRAVNESSGLASGSEHITEPERRTWTLRDAAGWLVVRADAERAATLRAVGKALVENAQRLETPGNGDQSSASAASGYISTVRNWASGLDRDRYRMFEHDGMTYVQAVPDEETVAAMREGNDDLQRGQHATRIFVRYFVHQRRSDAEPVTDEELAADLAIARALLDDPPRMGVYEPWEAPALISAVALDAFVLRSAHLPLDAIEFAAQTVLSVAEGAVPPRAHEYEGTFFEQGSDRSAARALPLLLLPAAESLHAVLGHGDAATGYSRIATAGMRLADTIADETRLHLARGMDGVWTSRCSSNSCHHRVAFAIVLHSMRRCILGLWNPELQTSNTIALDEPYIEALAAAADDTILMSHLDAAIRACGAAAVADVCVSAQALEALLVLVGAQRRALLAHEHNYDDRGTHTHVTARALLNLAALGNDSPLLDHVAAYADNADLLGTLLRCVAAAAEENQSRADACRRLWPTVMRQVLELNNDGHKPFRDHNYGITTLASLMPTPTYENSYLYSELEGSPIVWIDPLSWRTEIDAWLMIAAGKPRAVDSLIGVVRSLPIEEQIIVGLPWVSTAVFGDVNAVARASYLASSWLIDTREAAADLGVLHHWQRIVDALVVAGDSTLASYSD